MKYRIVYTNGDQSTIEADSNQEAARVAINKSWKDDLSDIEAVYRLGENGCIAAEIDLVAAGFAMEVK